MAKKTQHLQVVFDQIGVNLVKDQAFVRRRNKLFESTDSSEHSSRALLRRRLYMMLYIYCQYCITTRYRVHKQTDAVRSMMQPVILRRSALSFSEKPSERMTMTTG